MKPVGHHQVVASQKGVTKASDLGSGAVDGEVIARRFVVNLDTQLSNLRITQQPQDSNQAQDQAQAASTVSALAQRRELWHIGLIGLFIFALLEGVTLFQRRDERV